MEIKILNNEWPAYVAGPWMRKKESGDTTIRCSTLRTLSGEMIFRFSVHYCMKNNQRQ